LLTIRADGTLRVQEPWSEEPARTYQIGEKRVRELLEAMVGEHRFLECSKARIESGIAKANEGKDVAVGVADAGTAVIGCRLVDERHEVEQYALLFYAQQYPDVKPLADLAAIHRLLEREMWRAEIGGPEALASLVASVNAALKKEHPEMAPLRADELAGGLRRADGTVEARFHRFSPDGSRVVLVASARVPPEGEVEIGFWEPGD